MSSSLSLCLQARIAFLQGERKGQENLKSDLVRRIKMLEFALKQERSDSSVLLVHVRLCVSMVTNDDVCFLHRAKYHKLKYGKELNQGEMKMPSLDSGQSRAPPTAAADQSEHT